MLQKVMDFIERHSMIKKGDKIIVALSGGPDSICLIHLLNKLKDEYGIELYAAHVNHGLRGEEADADESYAEEFCRNLGIEFYSKRVDINKMSKELNISSETAGREARYSFFNELKDRLGANKVALAHNSNDQAETVLMRILRGSGMEGLNGIRPVRDGVYIRPILILSRVEIESYCEINKLAPRTDKSNFENIYNRNKVRLELIPYIQENFNKDIIGTLIRLSSIVVRDNDYIESVAEKKFKQHCSLINDTVTISQKLIEEHEAIISRVLRKAINEVKSNLINIDMIHINDVMDLFTIGTGKRIDLPDGIQAENIYGDIKIYNQNLIKEKHSFKGTVTLLDKSVNEIPLTRNVDEMNVNVSLRLVEKGENIKFGEDTFKKYFDYDKIKSSISLRYRQEGDRFTPYGMRGSKKIKDLFIDLKIPKDKRDCIPLVCFDEEIAWVTGLSVSNNYSVTKDTKNILEIKVGKGAN